jgi:hypothetical protein
MTNHNLISLPNADEAVRITPNGLHSGMDITVQNVNETAVVYLGGEGVSTSNYGFKIPAGSAFSVELPGRDSIYAVSNESNASIATLSFSLED